MILDLVLGSLLYKSKSATLSQKMLPTSINVDTFLQTLIITIFVFHKSVESDLSGPQSTPSVPVAKQQMVRGAP